MNMVKLIKLESEEYKSERIKYDYDLGYWRWKDLLLTNIEQSINPTSKQIIDFINEI